MISLYCTYMIFLLNQFHGLCSCLKLDVIVVILIVLNVIPVYHFIGSTTVFTKVISSISLTIFNKFKSFTKITAS